MHPVLRTVLQRLGLGVLTLIVVSVVIFSSLELLPGGYAENILGQGATPETVANFKKELGLDRPAYVRYFEWIGGVAQGDFGASYSGVGGTNKREVAHVIAPRLYNTFFLAILTAIIAVPLSLFLGVMAALYRNSWYDRIVNAVTLTTIAAPEFLIAYLLMLLFALKWKWFPSLSTVGETTPFFEHLYRAALPAITLTLYGNG
jgi:peptide/nickel transport system permease protein